MIKIIPAQIGSTSPDLYAIEIDENICNGYSTEQAPTAVVTVSNSGSSIASGGTTLQKVVFAITITYAPCGCSSETKVKTFAETATFAAPGTVTITPTIGSASVTPTKTCFNKARGIMILTSVSIAYA